MNPEEKVRKEREAENLYHCEICKRKYSEEEGKAKVMCCDRKLTPLQDLYRSDPSPSGP